MIRMLSKCVCLCSVHVNAYLDLRMVFSLLMYICCLTLKTQLNWGFSVISVVGTSKSRIGRGFFTEILLVLANSIDGHIYT